MDAPLPGFCQVFVQDFDFEFDYFFLKPQNANCQEEGLFAVADLFSWL